MDLETLMRVMDENAARAQLAQNVLRAFVDGFRVDSVVVEGDEPIRMGSAGPQFVSAARCFYNGWIVALGVHEDNSAIRAAVARGASLAATTIDGASFNMIGNYPVASITRAEIDAIVAATKDQLWRLDGGPACQAAEANRLAAEAGAQ